jgi:thioredoxin reductase
MVVYFSFIIAILILLPASALLSEAEVCIVGAGPAGLQLGHLFDHADNRPSFVILERAASAGSYFQVYPRHRKLISINKRSTGRERVTPGGRDYNLRHDWHSLLTSESLSSARQDELLFNQSRAFFPPADSLVAYLQKFASVGGRNGTSLPIEFNSEVELVIHKERGGYILKVRDVVSGDTRTLLCTTVVMASGLSESPLIGHHMTEEERGADLLSSYGTFDTNSSLYFNQSVGILGCGNSAFETWASISEEAAYVHVHCPSELRFAYASHYVGDLRSVNLLGMDNYLLKSQDFVFAPSGPLTSIKNIEGVFEEEIIGGTRKICMNPRNYKAMMSFVNAGTTPAGYSYNPNEHSLTFAERQRTKERYCYDTIIKCAGFQAELRPLQNFSTTLATSHGRTGRKFPVLSPNYESTSHAGLFFAGAASHGRDYRLSSGGFIHGLRYTARALFYALQARRGEAWPYTDLSPPSISHVDPAVNVQLDAAEEGAGHLPSSSTQNAQPRSPQLSAPAASAQAGSADGLRFAVAPVVEM